VTPCHASQKDHSFCRGECLTLLHLRSQHTGQRAALNMQSRRLAIVVMRATSLQCSDSRCCHTSRVSLLDPGTLRLPELFWRSCDPCAISKLAVRYVKNRAGYSKVSVERVEPRSS
jgi:hypothetical protein